LPIGAYREEADFILELWEKNYFSWISRIVDSLRLTIAGYVCRRSNCDGRKSGRRIRSILRIAGYWMNKALHLPGFG
jgi:hypothetical protein